ncbi:MAG TPA: GTPase HflX [Terriglobales bacterium]|nr:GTPase HflX [Terriglobales bacterium]
MSRDTLRAAPERVFLVGVDYRTRASGERQPPHPQKKKTGGNAPPSISLPAEARAAREAVQPRSSNGDRARGFTAEDSLAELQELTLSAGAEVVGQFLQRREKPDPATLIGRGKLEEVAAAAASAHADLIIFDHELSPSQQRNIEHAAHRRILDRTQLILDIFARHARTREGQMQVELAQLQYLLPRLTGRGIEMSQLGGGIGTRGPGETQLETDRRRINRRIQHIKGQLENVRRIRGQQRQRRESVPVATVALVGYTNAGKSTLFNALTRANVLASSRMFATLDPTLRSVTLPSRRKILLSDTVGFIRNLPHTLVSAFRATLEEVQRAALILHVSDATSPNREVQDAQVEAVLRELSVYEKPRLMVLNKIDLLGAAQRQSLLDTEREVHVSAKQGIGLSTLLDRIDEMLREDAVSRVRLRVPQQEGKVLSLLEARARIFSRSYHDGLVEMEAQAPESLLRKLRPFVME